MLHLIRFVRDNVRESPWIGQFETVVLYRRLVTRRLVKVLFLVVVRVGYQ